MSFDGRRSRGIDANLLSVLPFRRRRRGLNPNPFSFPRQDAPSLTTNARVGDVSFFEPDGANQFRRRFCARFSADNLYAR